MSRSRAEMMPADTDPPRPNGLPIASTQSPTRIASLSPNGTNGSGEAGSTFSTAMSVLGSRPTSSASSDEPSVKLTMISSASSMTWLLVTTKPEGSITKPEPSELTVRGPRWLRSKKSRNMSPKGAPGGISGISAPGSPTVWRVEMLTTAGDRRSARSAKLDGGEDCAEAICGAPKARPRPRPRAIAARAPFETKRAETKRAGARRVRRATGILLYHDGAHPPRVRCALTGCFDLRRNPANMRRDGVSFAPGRARRGPA